MAESAAAPAAEATAAPAKKGRSKMLIIILVAVVVLIVGGVGAYFAFAHQGEESASEAGAAGKQAKGKTEKKPLAPAIYVELDPPFVANFEAKGMMRFLQVTIEVMTRDPATVDMLKLHNPKIRNDLLMLLSNQTYETISTREGKDQLRAEALKAVAAVINAEGGQGKHVEQLFFTSFVMQ